jgi:hypothetical protein
VVQCPEHVFCEQAITRNTAHPFCIRQYASFQARPAPPVPWCVAPPRATHNPDALRRWPLLCEALSAPHWFASAAAPCLAPQVLLIQQERVQMKQQRSPAAAGAPRGGGRGRPVTVYAPCAPRRTSTTCTCCST